jgi:hypothetical protein
MKHSKKSPAAAKSSPIQEPGAARGGFQGEDDKGIGRACFVCEEERGVNEMTTDCGKLVNHSVDGVDTSLRQERTRRARQRNHGASAAVKKPLNTPEKVQDSDNAKTECDAPGRRADGNAGHPTERIGDPRILSLTVGRKMIHSNRITKEGSAKPTFDVALRDRRKSRRPSNTDPTPGTLSTVHPDFIKQIHRLPADRRELVFRIRRQLAEGTYETDEKLESAFSRMLESVLTDGEGRTGR